MIKSAVTAIAAMHTALVGSGDKVEWLVRCFPQTWPDTSCGFGGPAGQAVTTAYTVVLEDPNLQYGVRVFHNGRFAYAIEDPNHKFWDALYDQKLPGAGDTERIREMQRGTTT